MNKQYWIFDLDGTLTIPQHDFTAMKKECSLPQDIPLLEGVMQQPEPNRSALLHKIKVWEKELAETAKPSSDALFLVSELHRRGKHMAILTRNLRELAIISLRSANLLQYFSENVIFGRDCAKPKPDPEGIYKIIEQWSNIVSASSNPDKHSLNASIEQIVMIGDHDFDIEAGFRAGVTTVHIVRSQVKFFSPKADVCVNSLYDLLE
jgi:phosphoglycolate phosphatase-like HAD superfamily hydrolase